jgi:hypothetical protein
VGSAGWVEVAFAGGEAGAEGEALVGLAPVASRADPGELVDVGGVGPGPGVDVVDLDAHVVGAAFDGAGAGGLPLQDGALQGGGSPSEVA